MSRYRPLLAALVALVVVTGFAAPATADASLSITNVSLPDSVTQGDSFDLTVSVSGEELQGDTVDVSLTLPNGLSCSPSGTQQVTLSGSGTGQATFDCSADVEGDYTGEITVSATATNNNDGSTLSRSTQTGLEVLSPASLTLSTSLGDSSVQEGDSTSLTASIHNAGDASTSYSISLASSSGYSASVTSGSESGTVDGGSTVSIQYSLTGDSAGTHDVDPTVNGGNGQTLSESVSLDVTSSGGGSGGGGHSGSSGGGGGGSATQATETATSTEEPLDATPESDIEATPDVTEDDSVEPTPDETTEADTEAPETEADADETATEAPGTEEEGETPESGGDGAGFGFAAAVVALLAVAALVARR